MFSGCLHAPILDFPSIEGLGRSQSWLLGEEVIYRVDTSREGVSRKMRDHVDTQTYMSSFWTPEGAINMRESLAIEVPPPVPVTHPRL